MSCVPLVGAGFLVRQRLWSRSRPAGVGLFFGANLGARLLRRRETGLALVRERDGGRVTRLFDRARSKRRLTLGLLGAAYPRSPAR
jgi:hypothetical protein